MAPSDLTTALGGIQAAGGASIHHIDYPDIGLSAPNLFPDSCQCIFYATIDTVSIYFNCIGTDQQQLHSVPIQPKQICTCPGHKGR